MKKTFLLLALALAGAQIAHAQEVETRGGREVTMREHLQHDLANRGYTNFAYVTQKMIEPVTGLEGEESKWGAAFSKGRNFVLHQRPILGMAFVAINANWFDANYAHYIHEQPGLTTDSKTHQLDLSVGIGPSIHIMPIGRLGVHAYCRYHPGYGAYANNTDGEFLYVMGGVVQSVVAGGALSWGAIALGAEARWGTGDYKSLGESDDYVNLEGKLKTSGLRAYLSLRF